MEDKYNLCEHIHEGNFVIPTHFFIDVFLKLIIFLRPINLGKTGFVQDFCEKTFQDQIFISVLTYSIS